MTSTQAEGSKSNASSKENSVSKSGVEKEDFEMQERNLKLRNLKVDLWVKPLSFISAVIAVSIAYFTIASHQQQKEKLQEESYILEERLSFSQKPVDDKSSVLLVEVDLVNKGGKTLRPYAHALVEKKLYNNEGLYLIVYEIPTKPNRLVDDSEGEVVYGPHNILKKYSNSQRNWYDSYRIKPRTTYHEGEAVILERKKLYQVLVRFFGLSGVDEGWTITERRYVYVD